MDAKGLKQALKALGWSQAELAKRVEIHPNSVSKMVKRNQISGPVAAYVDLAQRMRA